jgi:hypothetical protein
MSGRPLTLVTVRAAPSPIAAFGKRLPFPTICRSVVRNDHRSASLQLR